MRKKLKKGDGRKMDKRERLDEILYETLKADTEPGKELNKEIIEKVEKA